MSNAEYNSQSYRFSKTTINGRPLGSDIVLTAFDVNALPSAGGILTGGLVIKNSWPVVQFQNTSLGNTYNIEFDTNNNFSLNQLGVGYRLTLRSDGYTDILGSLTVSGDIYANNDSFSIRSDANNQHLWFKQSNDVERALIWHEGTSDQLKFRVRDSNKTAVLEKNGSFWANRFIATDAHIGFHCQSKVNGTDGGLVRGPVQAGSWSDWNSTAPGLMVDCPDAPTSAHTIWKATYWGGYHVAAMAVHAQTQASAVVVLHVGGTYNNFTFNANSQGFAAGGWHTGSDARFKDKIQPLAKSRISYLDKVCSLEASSFVYKSNPDSPCTGFIAQQVREILPEAVSSMVDTTLPESEQADSERLYIDSMAIIAAQNEAIKELRAMVIDLAKQINP